MAKAKPIRLLMSTALAVALAGGSTSVLAQESPGATGDPMASAPAEPIASGSTLGGRDISGDLQVFGFGGETGDEIATVRTQYFRELYPDVSVTFNTEGWDEATFLTSLQSSDPPDVVNIPRNIAGTYISNGVLMPLTDCIAASGVDTSVYREAALTQLTVDDQLYGFPQFYNSRVWMIDDTVFEEAGLDPETFDFSDWQAIADANTAMTRVENGQVSRIGIDPKLPEFLPLWSMANGVNILSEDGRTSQLDDPAVAEALDFTSKLHDAAGGRAPFLDFRDTWDFFGAANEFAQHQVGAFPMEQWYLNVLAENSPDVALTVKPFLTRDGQPITWADGDAFAIVSNTDNPDAACEWGHVMTAAETWVRAAQARADARAAEGLPFTGVYTANTVADDQIFSQIVDLSATPTFQEAVQVVLDTQDAAFATPPSPAGAEVEQAWRAAVDQALTGGMAAADALAQADQEAQSAIDQAGQ
jgi:multiple sugar transport system substrate-binding protein